jgi:polysaccharide pyruvyl transferase WcaK-like protein
MTIRTIFNPFPFYGNGNVGDDFMLDGFLKALEGLKVQNKPIHCMSVHYPASQELRFKTVTWNRPPNLGPEVIWAGIGDTPFQLTWGDWILEMILGSAPEMKKAHQRLLICSGAEAEIAPRKEDFAKAAALFDRISARDQKSFEIFQGLGVPSDRLSLGADLAHLSLRELSATPSTLRAQIGVALATETMSDGDVAHAANFLRAHRESAVMVAGDIRNIPHHEAFVLNKMIALGQVQPDYELMCPKYHSELLSDIYAPFASCATLISSRYHGLLAGAWAGRRVGAIGRSSKVTALAEELGVPIARLPLEARSLDRLQEEAVVVPREKLLGFCGLASDGVRFCLGSESA